MESVSTHDDSRDPFALTWDSRRTPAPVRRSGLRLVECLLGLRKLQTVYAQVRAMQERSDFAAAALDALQVRWTPHMVDASAIPRTGGLLVVANHPFGGLEGLVLAAWLQSLRPDAKLLANYLLARIPELRSSIIPVDPFGGPGAPQRNRAGVREAVRWLKAGGAVALFPAGEVAHLRWCDRCVTDPPWNEVAARLVTRTACNVLPVFFAGQNGPLFQLGGLVHPRLRTLLLPRELANKQGAAVEVCIGLPIAAARLRKLRDPRAVTAFLRLRTFGLRPGAAAKLRSSAGEPIGPPPRTAALEREIHALRPEALLVETPEYGVYCAPADALRGALREIGRLRELTFRAVGEGTGHATDLDRFDSEYRHLFVWQRARREIVGAYRLGLTDEIVPRCGVAGLYTHSLFRFGRRLIDQLGPAIELGRSFVVAEYQRSYAPLMLLWKGIGQFILAQPRYRRLFGAVSISDRYDSMTKRLLMAFLREHAWASRLAGLSRPRNPPRIGRLRAEERVLTTVAQDMDDVDEIVRAIETDGRGMPILLRQYLKLNARLLGFNVDRHFSDCIDGLFYVDLASVPRTILERYLGRDAAVHFLARHAPTEPMRAINRPAD